MVTRKKNAIHKGKTYDVLSTKRENGNGTQILGKSDVSKKQKKEEIKLKKEETKTKKDADSC